MKAPERLYLSKNIYSTFVYQTPNPEDETEVEYTRTDAFIEKACEWINIHDSYSTPTNVLVEDFRKAMKGE